MLKKQLLFAALTLLIIPQSRACDNYRISVLLGIAMIIEMNGRPQPSIKATNKKHYHPKIKTKKSHHTIKDPKYPHKGRKLFKNYK